MGRLEVPIRITLVLIVVAPLLDLALVFSPPLWSERAWRVGVAGTLSGVLTVPTGGALVLALLAVARPSPAASALALGASGLCAILAGLATGVLGAELVPASALPFDARASVVWEAARALVTAVAALGMMWGVARHGHRRTPGAALPAPPKTGIELLD